MSLKFNIEGTPPTATELEAEKRILEKRVTWLMLLQTIMFLLLFVTAITFIVVLPLDVISVLMGLGVISVLMWLILIAAKENINNYDKTTKLSDLTGAFGWEQLNTYSAKDASVEMYINKINLSGRLPCVHELIYIEKYINQKSAKLKETKKIQEAMNKLGF